MVVFWRGALDIDEMTRVLALNYAELVEWRSYLMRCVSAEQEFQRAAHDLVAFSGC